MKHLKMETAGQTKIKANTSQSESAMWLLRLLTTHIRAHQYRSNNVFQQCAAYTQSEYMPTAWAPII
jgi:hypothetical protein